MLVVAGGGVVVCVVTSGAPSDWAADNDAMSVSTWWVLESDQQHVSTQRASQLPGSPVARRAELRWLARV